MKDHGDSYLERFGQYKVDPKTGEVKKVVKEAPDWTEKVYRPASEVVGPTLIGEWLMVDLRVAKAVPVGSRLWEICQALGERSACGVVGSTLVVDVVEAKQEDRVYLLDRGNWPRV